MSAPLGLGSTGEERKLPAELRVAAGQHVLWSFPGPEPTGPLLEAIRSGASAGVVLYRYLNVVSPAQVRELCDALQAARPAGAPPLIVATDQEGGQLQAIGEGATAWPGNLALGAAGSPELARRTGRAIGRELAAMGINFDYAPVCDLANDPSNPVIGTRAFGDNPVLVGTLAAAFIEGLQSAGVAASAKHFPGHGAARGDSHHGLSVVALEPDDLRATELRPFAAAIERGVASVMIGHLAVPALEDGRLVPATASPAIVRGLLRNPVGSGGLGYDGLVVSDALDMGAIQRPGGLPAIAIAATRAGIDLMTPGPKQAAEPDQLLGLPEALLAAVASGELDAEEMLASAERVLAVRRWIGRSSERDRPSLDVLDGDEHGGLAAEIARRSVTLVRDPRGLLPVADVEQKIAVIVPRPADLTPADTSSQIRIELAEAFRRRRPGTLGIEVPMAPSPREVLDAADRARAWIGDDGLAVVATIDAVRHPGQVGLIEALAGAGVRTVALALRSPHDATVVASGATVVCGCGIQPPIVEALAEAVCGEIGFSGRLPVSLDAPADRAPGR